MTVHLGCKGSGTGHSVGQQLLGNHLGDLLGIHLDHTVDLVSDTEVVKLPWECWSSWPLLLD